MIVAADPAMLALSEHGALREAIGGDGRVHLDRWLPFVVLHCGAADSPELRSCRRMHRPHKIYKFFPHRATDFTQLSRLGHGDASKEMTTHQHSCNLGNWWREKWKLQSRSA